MNYLVQITNSSPGNFDIYYTISGTETLATIVSPSGPASNIPLASMLSGVLVNIPNNAETVIVKNVGGCETCFCEDVKEVDLPTPPAAVVVPNLCLSGFPLCPTAPGNQFCIQLIPNGTYNGKNAWLSLDGTVSIIWSSNTLNYVVSSTTQTDYIISGEYNVQSPLNNNWQVLGGGIPGKAFIYEGSCECVASSLPSTLTCPTPPNPPNPVTQLYADIVVEQPGCIPQCSGAIIPTASGGVPPYSYSIDGGITYKSFPTFSKLCSGNYNIKIKDSQGTIYSDSVTLNQPPPVTNYIVSHTYNKKFLSQTNTSATINYKYTFNVTPLPVGVTIGLSISSILKTYSSPNNITFSLSSSVIKLNKNGVQITSDDIVTTNNQSSNKIPSCEDKITYNSTIKEDWSNLVNITSTDTLELDVTFTVNYSFGDICAIGQTEHLINYDAFIVNGCSCCTVSYPEGNIRVGNTTNYNPLGGI